MKKEIIITHLYPIEMNIYGDMGNIIALRKRLEWRGYKPRVDSVNPGDDYDFSESDIIFGGGGQDQNQLRVAEDLQAKAEDLTRAAKDGVVMLAVCGTYQLFGHGFLTKDGKEIPGISIFQAQTRASDQRMLGNIVVETEFGQLVGFENHSGQTTLEEGQKPLGKVIKGGGNNIESSYEGAVTDNVFGTYLHGPLLPKNPQFADELILRAVKRKFGQTELKSLENGIESRAAQIAKSRPE